MATIKKAKSPIRIKDKAFEVKMPPEKEWKMYAITMFVRGSDFDHCANMMADPDNWEGVMHRVCNSEEEKEVLRVKNDLDKKTGLITPNEVVN